VDNQAGIHIRLADSGDDDFILGLVERFVGFELPPWRRRGETAAGIRQDLARHLRDQPAGSFLFVAEDDDGQRVGFLHLQTTTDFFTGASNCHISDLAVATGHDGKGVGSTLARFALDDIGGAGRKVIPSCSFVAGYIQRHPEAATLVAP